MDVDLQLASLVDGGVEEGEEALCQCCGVSMLNADFVMELVGQQRQDQRQDHAPDA